MFTAGIKNIHKILLTFILLNFGLSANALQAIITVPSGDALKKNTILIKDVSVVSPFVGKNVQTTPSINYGIGWNSEISIAVPVNIKFQDGNTTEKINIEAKKVFFLGDKNNRLTVGGLVGPSVNMPVCPDMYVFAHVSKVIPKTNTMLLAGGFISGAQHFTNQGGVTLAAEQALSKRIKAQVEWNSGGSNRSNFGAGLKYKAKDDLSISAAVILPMQNRDNVGFQLIVSKFIFPDKKENL